MSQDANADDILSVGSDGFVTAEEVRFLRNKIFRDGIVSASELDALFQLGERAPDGDREWHVYFQEAAADFYLREEQPSGYFTQDEFDTLSARITRDGDKASMLEMELMLTLMEKATTSPPALADFIAAQFKRHILEKPSGPSVNEADASLLRRFIYASGGDGNIAITAREAEFLFDISDAVANGGNHADWYDVFKKSIASHLMAHFGVSFLSRDEALNTHQSLYGNRTDNKSIGGFGDLFGRFTIWMSNQLGEEEKHHAKRNHERAAASAAAEKITPGEADWLFERIARDGAFTASEEALLQHLKTLDAQFPPRFQDLMARIA